jgi:hypothetical protein
MMFAVEKKVIESVVNYLATRPWREVNDMIAALSQVKPVVRPVETEEQPRAVSKSDGNGISSERIPE